MSVAFRAADIACLDRSELRLAKDTATEVYKSLRVCTGTSLENKLALDLSTVVLEAIRCIENNTSMQTDYLQRIGRYATLKAKTPLLRLGYCLTVVLEKLIYDRSMLYPEKQKETKSTNTATCSVDQQKASTSKPAAEIKEEPVDPDFLEDIKFEPVESLEEIKQEAPMEDVFCPGTGESRSAALGNNYCEDNPSPMPLLTKMSRQVNGDQTRKPYVLGRGTWKDCYLCGAQSGRFVALPKPGVKRGRFISRILTVSADDQARVQALEDSTVDAYFCVDHLVAQPKKLPLATTKTVTHVAKKEVSGDPDSEKRKAVLRCDLCDTPESPIQLSPKSPISYKRFFEKLVNLTPEQREKTNSFLENTQRAAICSKHFPKPKPVHPYHALVARTYLSTSMRLREKEKYEKAKEIMLAKRARLDAGQ